jgi:serine/threonine protein kinase
VVERSNGVTAETSLSSPSTRPDVLSETSSSVLSIVSQLPSSPPDHSLIIVYPVHYNGIIHRDIKPANLLWSTDRQRVKIADFGVSHFSYAQSLGVAASSARQRSKRRKGKNDAAELLDPADRVLLDEEDLNRFAGTPSFLAPEVVDGLVEDTTPLRPPKRKLGKGVDIWALGVTLYCLLFGRPPWIEPGNEYRTYYLIMCTEWPIHSVMGFDRLSTGGRPHSQPPTRTRAGKEVALPEGVLVMRLLDSLLQKDSDRRMHLDDVKVN